jgi:hypothetical protein
MTKPSYSLAFNKPDNVFPLSILLDIYWSNEAVKLRTRFPISGAKGCIGVELHHLFQGNQVSEY